MPSDLHDEAMTWILSHDHAYRPTEVTLPIVFGIAPIYRHSEPAGAGWFARLDVDPRFGVGDEPISECDHVHVEPADAWSCAEALLRSLVNTAVRAPGEAPTE